MSDVMCAVYANMQESRGFCGLCLWSGGSVNEVLEWSVAKVRGSPPPTAESTA